MPRPVCLASVAAPLIVGLAFAIAALVSQPLGEALLLPGWLVHQVTANWLTSTQAGYTQWALVCYVATWWLISFGFLELRRRLKE
jgi:hypothetical protein